MAACGGSLLLSTGVSHTLAALRTAVRDTGATAEDFAPGVLRVSAQDVSAVLTAVRAGLSPVEAAEVRAVDPTGRDGDELVAVALAAPTLAQLQARVEHADLLPLFAEERQAFRSVYQPIVDLDGSHAPPVVGYEALLRASGAAGPVMPSALFAAAEQAGWLHVLDRVGRTTAIRGAQGWLGERLLFVNFLPTTIYRPQVCLRTTELAAEQAGLRLDQLVFEVTESERVTDLAHLSDVFAYYRERGCKVALDDLGAGYSSLNMLVELQPDVVKLDKDIVQRLPDPVSRAVVKAVVEITHAYGGLVLAECVETGDQAAAAADLGVDLGQGWHFGRPEERSVAARDAPTAGARPSATALRAGAARVFTGNDPAVAVGQTLPEATHDRPLSRELRGSADVEALLARAVELCSAGVTITDATVLDLPLIYVNEGFEAATGYRAAEVLGRNCRFLQGPDTDPVVLRGIREAVRSGREHVAVLRNYRKDGQPWWNELRLSPVKDADGRVTHYFGFQSDVTARVTAEQQVAHQATHDELTGLPNRAHLLQHLDRALAQARGADRRLAVLFIDLDGFKAVNDRLGHATGDLVLQTVAACLSGALRTGDLLARHSGDEFVAVLSDVPPDSAGQVAQRAVDAVLGSLDVPLHVGGLAVALGASVGVALFPEHGASADELLGAADSAMYQAKSAGRGRAALA